MFKIKLLTAVHLSARILLLFFAGSTERLCDPGLIVATRFTGVIGPTNL